MKSTKRLSFFTTAAVCTVGLLVNGVGIAMLTSGLKIPGVICVCAGGCCLAAAFRAS